MAEGLVISNVLPGSIAAELELEPGDIIVEVDGHKINDILDLNYWTSEPEFTMLVARRNHEIWELEIEKDDGESLGIELNAVSVHGLKKCRNNCVFCFVRQMPAGMRETLYDRDDDYRLSVTQGSYITLSNLKPEEFARIIDMHISPLYISVHAFNSEARQKLMRNPKAGRLAEQIKMLADAGITLHTQVVLVPGYNDGAILEDTVQNLAQYYPQVQSIGVVPVGLTKYRHGLKKLTTVSRQDAENILRAGMVWQEKYQNKYGRRLVYFSDEFYVLAGQPFPGVETYDDFPQIENGIGMAAKFLDELADELPRLPAEIPERTVHIITGVSAAKLFHAIAFRLRTIKGLNIHIHTIVNHFFGETVTVAGLLTAHDIAQQTQDLHGHDFLIPSVMLKAGEDIFLDGYDVKWLEKAINGKAVLVENDAVSFLEGLFGTIIWR